MSAGGSSGAAAAAGTAASALCLLLSLTAVAVCLLLGAKTAELQGRLAALEERGAAGHGPLLDALQPRVEQLFREVSGGAAPRRPRVGSTHGPAAARRQEQPLRDEKVGEGASGSPGIAPSVSGFSSLGENFLPCTQLLPFLLPFPLIRVWGQAKPFSSRRENAPGGKASGLMFENRRLSPLLHWQR